MRVSDGPIAIAAAYPERLAIVSGERQLTYGQLRALTGPIAAGVCQRLQGGPSRPVALAITDGIEFLAAFLGIVEGGGIAAPVSASWSEGETKAALAACPAAFVIGGAPGTRGLKIECVSMESLAAVSDAVVTGRGASDSPFYVGFSSGSTGAPKAIVRNNREWLNSFLAMTTEFAIGPGMTVAVPGGLFFSFSLIAALHALSVGATVHLPAREGMRGVTELARTGCDAMYILPSLLDALTRAGAPRDETFPGVRTIITAGEKLAPDTRRAVAAVLPSASICEYYGASELGFVTVMHAREGVSRPSSVGRAFVGTELAILDADARRLPPGEVGYVCARTEYGFAGYYGDAEGPARISHGSYQTVGDLGWLDEDGYLYLAGRGDSMLIIRGENIYPEQVEQALAGIDGVCAVAVTGEPAATPTHLVAVAELEPGFTADEILGRARGVLSPRLRPRRIIAVDALPRTPAGKVARQALAASLSSSVEAGVRTEAEHA